MKVNLVKDDEALLGNDQIDRSAYKPFTTALIKEDTYDEAMKSVRKEFELTENTGLDGVHMFLPFNVWYREREAFLDHLDRFLGELDRQCVPLMRMWSQSSASH